MVDRRHITIISGGQTGADRAALDFANANGINHGGWCPRRRLAEDGPIPPHYHLQETPSRKYAQRTEWNVRDSDATVAFTIGPAIVGGTALALACARRLAKPFLHLSRQASRGALADEAATVDWQTAVAESAAKLRQFLDEHDVARLNVAGPRGSQEPEIARFVHDVLLSALR